MIYSGPHAPYCRFQCRMDSGDTSQHRSLNEKQYVLLSMGALHTGVANSDDAGEEDSSTSMLRHTLSSASACACDVMTCSEVCSCPGGFIYQMQSLHGKVWYNVYSHTHLCWSWATESVGNLETELLTPALSTICSDVGTGVATGASPPLPPNFHRTI